jgi:PadR family transcriptional regulator, regulatory protein PadR
MQSSKLDLLQGTIYAALVRLELRGWILSAWETSGKNRKAKFYSPTRTGRHQLAAAARYRKRLTGDRDRVFAMSKDFREEPA